MQSDIETPANSPLLVLPLSNLTRILLNFIAAQMATQYLPSIECRDARLCDLLKRVAENHEIDHGTVQGITHYNPGTGEVDFWFWPLDKKGVRIPPDHLSEEHMLLLFDGPCCFCAYLDGSCREERTLNQTKDQ
ncbi:hypothetical protein CC1G_12826 [Coprinopsis cinerea okayama7|uniref:Uncharacterized protein n=1 Tax=Coprinopsis cinerea (strain Okayama-7 / 130 / ATCC MYA-4618 / FGSC 9003) TaxID=240176 RepID=A8PD82_COPC7|nr:hypothetical protein CC1G_12826 [Coprinopsis cinerea okayama7\|eukprot:XP_001840553.2 hypothetical protein CC1G_12826 [Coprinopsis cinerea okayama7\